MTNEIGLVDMSTVDENDVGGGVYVPAGRYEIYIANHEIKSTANGGLGINITYQIVEGEHAGRQPKEFFNLRHATSVETVRIASVKIKQLTIAAGLNGDQILTEALIAQWYGKKIVADLQLEESDDARYPEPSNRVRQFFHPDGVPADIAPPTGIIPAKGKGKAAAGTPPPPPTGQAAAHPASQTATPPAATAPAPTTAQPGAPAVAAAAAAAAQAPAPAPANAPAPAVDAPAAGASEPLPPLDAAPAAPPPPPAPAAAAPDGTPPPPPPAAAS